MKAIEFIKSTEKMDFEKKGFTSPNLYKIANQIIYKNYIPPFELPFTPSRDVQLQKLTMNENTGVAGWSSIFTLDSVLFSGSNFIGEVLTGVDILDNGYYRLITTSPSYISSCILECKGDELTELFGIEIEYTDYEGDTFLDDVGDTLIELLT